MAKTKDGFYKLMGQIVGNNDYILLGGGGTKKISDFALSSDLNNYIQIGTSGVNKGYLRNVKVNNNNYSFLSNVNTDGFKIYAHSELGDNQLSFSNSNGLNYTSLKYLKFDIPDNGGRDSYLLIADVSGYSVNGEEKVPVVDAALIGTIYGYRVGNQSRTVVYNIVSCVSVYNTTGQTLTLYTDLYNNRVIDPYIVSYDNKKYIALRKRGSGFPVYFIGITRGLLNEYITLNVNTGETLPEGMLILVSPNTGSNIPSITSTSIYQNGVTNTILHSGNYQNYLGYIGTTAVLKNSGSLDLTGIKHITSATTNTYSIGSSNNIWNKVYAHEVDVISGVFARNNNEYKSLIELSGNIVKVGDGFKSSDGILDLVGSSVRFWGGTNCAINLLNISGESGINIDRMNSIGGNKIKLTVTGGKVMADGYYMYPNNNDNGYMIMTNGTSMHINNLLTAFSGGNISSNGNVISLSQKSITVGGTTKTIAVSNANIINSLTLTSSSSSTTNLSLTVNVNGVSKNTTITNLYAYHSKTADALKSHDTRNVDNTPSTFNVGARFEFKANNTDGLKDGSSYHGILHFRPYGSNSDFSGGYPHQLAFTENQNIWYRKAKSDTEWNAWKQLAFKSDIPNVTNYYWANIKVSDTSSTTTTPTFGTTSVLGLKITNTNNAKHIEFSRGSSTSFPYNYIAAPAGGIICMLPNGATNDSSSGIQFSSNGIHPATSNAYSLGTGDKQWNKLFVAEGNFNGNVNIAVDHGIYQYSDGTAKEALFLGSNRFELGKGLKNVTTWLNGLDFKFNTSSVNQAVIITSNGRVGIGNVGGAPSEKLHIGEGNVLANTFKAYQGGFFIKGSGALDHFRIFRDQSTSALWILASNYNGDTVQGDLRISGINANPLDKLTIYGKVLPGSTNTFDLGSTISYWNNLYINNVITPYSRHIKGEKNTAGTIYYELGTLNTDHGILNIVGSIGGWESQTLTHINISICARSSCKMIGFVSKAASAYFGSSNTAVDIVIANNKVYLELNRQYSTWNLNVFASSLCTISYTGTSISTLSSSITNRLSTSTTVRFSSHHNSDSTVKELLDTSNCSNLLNIKKLTNYYSSRPNNVSPGITGDGSLIHFKSTSTAKDATGYPGDGHILHFNWDNTGGWDAQLWLGTDKTLGKIRSMNNGTWSDWEQIWTQNKLFGLCGIYSFLTYATSQTVIASHTMLEKNIAKGFSYEGHAFVSVTDVESQGTGGRIRFKFNVPKESPYSDVISSAYDVGMVGITTQNSPKFTNFPYKFVILASATSIIPANTEKPHGSFVSLWEVNRTYSNGVLTVSFDYRYATIDNIYATDNYIRPGNEPPLLINLLIANVGL